MIQEIIFKNRTANFTGRNGYFTCAGVELLDISDEILMIAPLTSKRQVGRCDISIPMEDVPALIEKLQISFDNWKSKPTA